MGNNVQTISSQSVSGETSSYPQNDDPPSYSEVVSERNASSLSSKLNHPLPSLPSFNSAIRNATMNPSEWSDSKIQTVP